jgi:hypothetical protein
MAGQLFGIRSYVSRYVFVCRDATCVLDCIVKPERDKIHLSWFLTVVPRVLRGNCASPGAMDLVGHVAAPPPLGDGTGLGEIESNCVRVVLPGCAAAGTRIGPDIEGALPLSLFSSITPIHS